MLVSPSVDPNITSLPYVTALPLVARQKEAHF